MSYLSNIITATIHTFASEYIIGPVVSIIHILSVVYCILAFAIGSIYSLYRQLAGSTCSWHLCRVSMFHIISDFRPGCVWLRRRTNANRRPLNLSRCADNSIPTLTLIIIGTTHNHKNSLTFTTTKIIIITQLHFLKLTSTNYHLLTCTTTN